MDEKQLMREAHLARANAYAPYSGFSVGAALLTGTGKIYRGCNIENASYGVTNCAERTAFFKAVSEGESVFLGIAITGGKAGAEPEGMCAPCGVCRQVMMEFCDADTFFILLEEEGVYRKYLLRELLPLGFGPHNLK